jgi:hypothetical protein
VICRAVQGLAQAYDAQGCVLAQTDYFAGDNYLLPVDVPTHGQPCVRPSSSPRTPSPEGVTNHPLGAFHNWAFGISSTET